MNPTEACTILKKESQVDVGRFYGEKRGLGLGAGLFFDSILCPIFDASKGLFATTRRPVYVLTHECDVDPSNHRPFNDTVCFCSVIPIDRFLKHYQKKFQDEDQVKNFLVNVAKRNVPRVVYIPPADGSLKLGGLVYLNNIDSTHISVFDGIEPIAALSAYGLRELDMSLRNSLFREKSDRLSLEPQR